MYALLTIKQAAEQSGYTTEWVRILIRRNKLIAVKRSNKWYVSPSSFNSYLTEQRKGKRRGRPKKKKQ